MGASPLGVGTYTIKAFAKKEGYTDSTVVEKTFTITFSNTVVEPSITARDEEGNGISTGILTIDTFAISTGTMGATIYYTVGPMGGGNPADPRTAATRREYEEPVSFEASHLGVGTYTVWAFAEMTGLNDSPLAMETFTVSQAPQVDTPSIDPSSGDVPHTGSLTISTMTRDATIHYTTDGNTPTRSSIPPYTTELEFSTLGTGNYPRTVTIKAFAVKSRHADSGEVSATFTIRDPVVKPIITARDEEGNGISTGILTIDTFTISTTPSDATIYYTVGPEGGADPADPRTAATRSEYTGAVSFGESPLGVGTYTIWAFAEMTGLYDSPLAMETFTVSQAPKVVTPSFNPSSGNVPHTGPLTISTTTRDATIYYTTDGSTTPIPPGTPGGTPTLPTRQYSPGLTFSSLVSSTGNYPKEVTVKAIAVKSRHADSGEVSAAFTIRDPVAKPIITVQNEDGDPITTNILTTHRFAINTGTTGATIYYTVGPEGGAADPADPRTAATRSEYTGPVSFGTSPLGVGTYTIWAIAEKDGIVSELASKTYTVSKPQVATPIISPSSGNVDTSQSLTISSTTGATIYYTRNGDDPSLSTSTPTAYTAPVSFGDSSLGVGTYTIKAFAKKADYTDSTVVEKTFTVRDHTVVQRPIFNPGGGTVAMPMIVVPGDSLAITSGTGGATIHYTSSSDGSEPSDPSGSSPTFPASATFQSLGLGQGTHIIKAIAVESSLTDSAVVSATFTIEPEVAQRPIFNPAGGTVAMPMIVVPGDSLAITSGTGGATIHYTSSSDGSTPADPDNTNPSFPASATFQSLGLGLGTHTIKAIAVESSMTDSAVVSATFTVERDVDADDDGLIDISSLDMLNNIRFNLAGTSYDDDSTDEGMSTDGGSTTGAPTTTPSNCEGRTTTTNLCGYELMQNLDFAIAAHYASESVNNDWRPTNMSGTVVTGDDIDSATNAGFSGFGREGLYSGVASDVRGGFTAIFEGNGFTINNFYSRNNATMRRQAENIGLFRLIHSNAIIRNVGMTNGRVYGSSSTGLDNIGGLVGASYSSEIRTSYSTGTANDGRNGNDMDVYTTGDNVGGLVGYSYKSVIWASYNTGKVKGGVDNDNVGGLVGSNDTDGRITASYNSGEVNGGDETGVDYVGGLTGQNFGTITASYNTGSVNGGAGGGDWVGGLVGSSGGGITASYNTGRVDGGAGISDYAGGLVGYSGNGRISASYNTGTVTGGDGANDFVGGLVGNIATISASYNTGAVDGGTGISDYAGGISGDPSGFGNMEIYNFGTVTGETEGFGGTELPNGVTSAKDLKGDSMDATTYAGATWNNASFIHDFYTFSTLGAWDFGNNMQDPALVYADYDGGGSAYACSDYPTTIPGTMTTIVCGQPTGNTLVGGNANQGRSE